jgi:hypothetical protein
VCGCIAPTAPYCPRTEQPFPLDSAGQVCLRSRPWEQHVLDPAVRMQPACCRPPLKGVEHLENLTDSLWPVAGTSLRGTSHSSSMEVWHCRSTGSRVLTRSREYMGTGREADQMHGLPLRSPTSQAGLVGSLLSINPRLPIKMNTSLPWEMRVLILGTATVRQRPTGSVLRPDSPGKLRMAEQKQLGAPHCGPVLEWGCPHHACFQ